MKRRRQVEQAVLLVDARIQALTADFTDRLTEVVMAAQARTLVSLQQDLTFSAGKVARSVQNRRTLQGLADLFMREMRVAGFDSAVLEMVHAMPGLTPYFQTVLNAIFDTLKIAPPRITFTPEDLQLAANVGIQTRTDVTQAVATLARQAQAKALFSFAAITPSDLAVFLARYTGQSVAQASGLAATGLTTYYRTIADLGFQELEKEYAARYTYAGPSDILNRVFCRHILDSNFPRTREQIDVLDNGQTGEGTCMRMAGGFRCRHQWIMFLERKHAIR